jgi:hypothetical protein
MALHLIIQYCNDPRPARQAEYDECLRRNLDNPHIAAVHNLVEPQTVVAEPFRLHAKHREHALPRWMTYRDAFEYASAHLSGQICALANLDIFLDPASLWDQVAPMLDSNLVLCLSRMEFNPDGPPFKDPGLNQMAFANSQDAWVFRAPIEVPACDFEIGTLGCDNAIAERFKRAGKVPVNLADRFRIFHYDRARGKNFANQAAVHAAEQAQRSHPHPHPEQQGQYLVPNMDQVKSVDQVLHALRVGEIDRYMIICDIMSHFIKISNP